MSRLEDRVFSKDLSSIGTESLYTLPLTAFPARPHRDPSAPSVVILHEMGSQTNRSQISSLLGYINNQSCFQCSKSIAEKK